MERAPRRKSARSSLLPVLPLSLALPSRPIRVIIIRMCPPPQPPPPGCATRLCVIIRPTHRRRRSFAVRERTIGMQFGEGPGLQSPDQSETSAKFPPFFIGIPTLASGSGEFLASSPPQPPSGFPTCNSHANIGRRCRPAEGILGWEPGTGSGGEVGPVCG